MHTHTIDVQATLTLHVQAADESEALAKVRHTPSTNPLTHLDGGVEVYELTLNPDTATYIHGDDDLAEVAKLVRKAQAAADGDSNDAEIEALRNALDAALRLRFPEIRPS